MSTAAKDLLSEVRGTYLNDPNATEATDDKLLSTLRQAYGLLQCDLESNGLQTVNEEVVKTITAGVDEYAPLPSDLVIPRTIWEREPNSQDEYRELTYRNNLPQLTPTPFLQYWTYRLDRIYFVPASTNREVKLVYSKAFPTINDPDGILQGKAELYLTAKTAALYLMFTRQSPTLAQTANEIAEKQLEELINSQVKLMQSHPYRRKGYTPFRTS